MRIEVKNKCPIAASLDLLGDRWTLVVLRDILLANVYTFSEIGSQEGIATNILNNRLEKLVDYGLIGRHPHATDQRRKMYLPKEPGIELIPVLVDLIIWGDNNTTARGQKKLAKVLQTDRDTMIKQFEANARTSARRAFE